MASRFQANFSYYPTLIFAPANVEFTNSSTVGTPIDDENTVAIDASGKIIEVDAALSTFSVGRIERYEWEFGDKLFANDKTPKHQFDFAGVYAVKLSIISNELFDIENGQVFRIKNSIVKNVDIGSMTYAWMLQHMTQPHQDAIENSQGFKDLISASSKMFDRMYAEIKETANLMDVTKVAPKFLEYFSDTLNHERFYAQKVGYAEQETNDFKQPFLDYDIFDRISKGIAGENEVEKFRQFIIDTASLFKQNGSRQAMENFFKLYGFVVKIKDLWTTNFGLKSDPTIIEDFLLDPTLEHTKSKFKYKGIGVTGFDNGKIQVRNNFSHILVDNYHYLSHHTYPNDLLTDTPASSSTSASPASGTSASGSPEVCESVFPIHGYAPEILAVYRDDGRTILDKSSCLGFDPNTNCTIAATDELCTEDNIKIRANKVWSGSDNLISGISYKFWNAPTNYVQSVINTVGTVPSGPNEIAELGDGDSTDDFLWADWNDGVTVPETIVGVGQSALTKPSWNTKLPYVNYATTQTNNNLIQIANTPIATEHDLFVVARGFIKIPRNAYYVFTLETGNTGTGSADQHVALFSLKHQTKMSVDKVHEYRDLNTLEFKRDNTDKVVTVGTSATGFVNLYSKVGEYGIVEIRQNEVSERSGDYYLEEGYYAFEIKATYSTLAQKKLKLMWESYTVGIDGSSIAFVPQQQFKPVPSSAFWTIDTIEEENIEDANGKGLLFVPNEYLEGGDIFTVAYSKSFNENTNVSGLVSTAEKYKNLEFNIRFSPVKVPSWEENYNKNHPQKTLMAIFRAVSKKTNLYADYDTYYAVVLNGKTGEVGVAQVGHSKEIDGAYYRYLNLNANRTDLDKVETHKLILDEDNLVVTLEEEKYYDLKVVVQDNKVSVLFRKNSQFAQAIDGVRKTVSQNLIAYADSDTYLTVIKDLDLNQSEVETTILDIKNQKIDIAEKYSVIDEAGAYGFAVKSSVFKIEQIVVNPLDKTEHKLLETVDKWKEIKPKFLDSRNGETLQYNSYGSQGCEKPLSSTFALKVSDSYDGVTNVYEIPSSVGKVDDNSVNKVYADNMTVTDLGTRFNVWVDKEFINTRFNNLNDVLEGLVVPVGNFLEPFINWGRIDDEASYSKTWQAGYTPFVTEIAHVLPHTVYVSGGTVSYASEMTRADTNVITLNGALGDYLNATNHSKYIGVWEEVCPNSVAAQWTVNNSTFDNKVFELIYRNNQTKTEVVGVRVLSEKMVEKLICRFCENAIVWGVYDVTLPAYATKNHPTYGAEVPESVTLVKYTLPIGKLSKEHFTFLPPPEILRSPNVTVNLTGVFAQHSFEGFTLLDKTTLKIDELNPWEKDYKSRIKCKYYLDVETSFIHHFNKFTGPLDVNEATPCDPQNKLEIAKEKACDLPNSFYMPQQVTNLLTYLEKNSVAFKDAYTWWTPKTLWLKRKFAVSYPENGDSTVFTGLNTPNAFYTGDEAISDAQGTKVVLQDGYDADVGKFILDASWCANSVGWDAEFATKSNSYEVGVFDMSAYNLIGFDNSTTLTMGNEKVIAIGNTLGAPLPLETVGTTGVKELTLGSYFVGEAGAGRSLMPVGLFNWFLTHANNVDYNVAGENVRAGWELSEWNDEFVQGFKFNSVFGQIESSKFKINKYWSFYPEHIPPFSSIVRVELSNNACSDSPVTRTPVITLGISDGQTAFFQVPPIIEGYPKWAEKVSRVFVDQHIIDSDQYHVRTNTGTGKSELVINNQLFNFEKFIGPTQFVVEFFNDKTFKLEDKIIKTDNFKNTRDINWLTMLETDGYYKIAKRLPETELKFTANKLPYEISEYKNSNVFKLLNKFEYDNPSKFSGGVNKETEIGLLGNHGSISTLMLADIESNNFELSADFIFDKAMLDMDLKKQFELILKAENNFVRENDEWGVTDFYFVGVGAFNFDVGLGMRSIDKNTGEVKETFLASFGDFNVRGVKADTWYTLKAIVTSTEIKVIFHERNQPERLVINYNINKKYEKLTERYLKGEFENLQAIIVGLEELGITYPDKLGNTVSKEFTFDKFKEEFAGTLPVNGGQSGFRTFNDKTYVSNVVLVANIPKQYKLGSTFDGTTFNETLHRIKNRFGLPESAEIKKMEQALNFTVFVQINDQLYYQYKDNAPEKYSHPIVDFAIIDDKIIVVEKESPTDSGIGLNHWAPGAHEIVWSLTSNTQNITTLEDFFDVVPGLTNAELERNGVEYALGMAVGTADITGSNVLVAVGDAITLTVGGIENVIWPLDGVLGRYNTYVRVYQEGFSQEYPILIKDKTFYKDGLKSYMDFADKKIKEVHINDRRLHIVFEDN